jgi:hypothetical protein
MNDITIERILFHAPCPTAPPDLLKRLQAGIVLSEAKAGVRPSREWQNPLRRWFPALAFSLLLLSCVIMIGVQANWGADLKRENKTLQAATANLVQLREQHVAFEKAAAQQDELAQLQKDNQELHALQAEVAQLRDLPVQIERLRSENQRLAATLAAPAPTNGANFFDEAQQQAERIQCVNNLKQLGLAMRIWAGDNDGKYPTSLVVMSNELSTVKVLICPSDKARKDYASLTFGQFQDNMTSYKLQTQPDNENYPECIVGVCPIHHNYLLADGSVQQVDPKKYVITERKGRFYLEQMGTAGSGRKYIQQVVPVQ